MSLCLSPYGELLYGERRLLPQRQVAELDAGLDVACPSTCGNTEKLAVLHLGIHNIEQKCGWREIRSKC